MCIIIDANCAAQVFASPPASAFVPIHRWINKQKGSLVVGGKNKAELFRIQRARLAIIAWNQKGRAFFINEVLINAKADELRLQNDHITSDDSHVLALAIISGARWLCSTGDGALCDDFKNRLVLSPKGRIYKYASHGKKLDHISSCYFSKFGNQRA